MHLRAEKKQPQKDKWQSYLFISEKELAQMLGWKAEDLHVHSYVYIGIHLHNYFFIYLFLHIIHMSVYVS